MSLRSFTRRVALLLLCMSLCWSAHGGRLNRLSARRAALKRATLLPSTCPEGSLISPCTCSLNRTSKNGLPEVSCINYEGGDNVISLGQVFQNLTDYLNQNGESKEFERLLLVNSKASTVNQTLFHGLQFRYLSIYETNLTTVEATTFADMADTLNYVLIKGDRLSTVFPSLSPLKNLSTLILNLGLYSFKQVPIGALVDLPNLQRVTINGVVNSISTNAFVNLPSLQNIKITNQLEKIDYSAFILNNENSTTNSSNEVTIDLSNNKLDENSFADGFIQLRPETSVTLDLTYNWIPYLPETVFRPFFEANSDNRLLLRNNKFECGRCESYWLVNNSTVSQSQLDVNCYMNNQLTIWNYDWSHCALDSGSVTSKASFLVVALVIQLFAFMFVN